MSARTASETGAGSPLGRLRHLEQQVNDRYGTAPAPASLGELLPEKGARFPLHWLRCPRDETHHFALDADTGRRILGSLSDGDHVRVPLHPLTAERMPGRQLVRSGHISFSASYRTAFYEPDADDPFGALFDGDDIVMLKLHLAEALPGIPGDRRLTRETLERCVWTSRILREELDTEALARNFSIIPEPFGLGGEDGGFLLRIMPAIALVPVFSLYAKDPADPAAEPLILAALRKVYGDDARAAAADAGNWLARPLLSPVLAGFRRGFSLEMHAQNTLVTIGDDRPIDHVFFRDMEGVLLFDVLREARDLPPLNRDDSGARWPGPGKPARRLFNRNVDHDLRRIYDGVLRALRSADYFDARDIAVATRAIRRASFELIGESGLERFAWPGHFWPVSRAPWGSGLRPGHYFRTRYR